LGKGQWRYAFDNSGLLRVDCDFDPHRPYQESEKFTLIRLPILPGSSMKQIDAAAILDMAMSGTTATLLARRRESALLVDVDNDTLRRKPEIL
jgi:hypothetical protein